MSELTKELREEAWLSTQYARNPEPDLYVAAADRIEELETALREIDGLAYEPVVRTIAQQALEAGQCSG